MAAAISDSVFYRIILFLVTVISRALNCLRTVLLAIATYVCHNPAPR